MLHEHVPTFWTFLRFSLAAVTPAKATTALSLNGDYSATLYYCEVFCCIFIFVILAFSILRAARETYLSEVQMFGDELKLIAEVIETRLSQAYMLTIVEIELLVHQQHAELVDLSRKARGLPGITRPVVVETVSSRDSSSTTSNLSSNPKLNETDTA